MKIVIHLKKRMSERGLTQTQLSEMTGVRQATISQISRGYVDKLHLPSIIKIADALEITDISKLLTFESDGSCDEC